MCQHIRVCLKIHYCNLHILQQAMFGCVPEYIFIMKVKGRNKVHMINIAVCDDQESIREDICEKIKKQKIKEKYRTDTFQTGEEVLEAMEQMCYDIYFLDIELAEGDMNGYKLAQEIRKWDQTAILIFLSSHDEYACEAFEVSALRFLRKPIVEEKFAEAFQKAMEIVSKGRGTFLYHESRITQKVQLKEILYFEVIGKEIIIKLINGTERKFKGTLKEVINTLRHSYFAQCYKSLYVQLEYVSYIGENEIELTNGEKLPVSRKYKKEFRNAYTEFCWMREGN